MSKTVIDELIVTLGLDPKDFKKGEKEAAAALVDLKKNAKETGEVVQKSADSGGSAIMALGKRVLTVAAIFKTLSFATRNILEASRATYDLSNASRHLNESARMLRNFENIGEIFGGTADAARKSVQGIKQAVHDLAFNGQMSQQLVQLGRLGVAFQGRDGRARDFKDIYLDTATSLQQRIASGQMSESDALMFAESAGFDGGLARSMIGGRESALAALAKQEARRQVSAEDIAAATANEQAITSAGQAKDTAFTAAQTKTTGMITGTAGTLEGAWREGATGDIGGVWEEITAGPRLWLGDLADATKAASSSLWEMAATGIGRSRGVRNNNPGNIRALPGQAADDKGFRIFNSMDEGIAAASRQLDIYAKRDGINTIGGIVSKWAPTNENDTSAYIKSVAKQTGISADAQLTEADRAAVLSAMFVHENGRNAAAAFDPASVADAISLQGSAAQWRGPSGGSSSTSVQIDQITVVTQATDANGIAGSIADATQRKLTAAQADQGMQ